MKRVYISRNYKHPNSAGGKAKSDIEATLEGMGYRNIGMKRTTRPGMVADFFRNLAGVAKAAVCMPRGGVLVLQYPMKKYFGFLCFAAHLNGTKVVAVIHDLGSFRRKRLTPAKEVKRLNLCDYIVAHTPAMREWLLRNGCKREVGTLKVFDYLSRSVNASRAGDGPAEGEGYVVNYAGQLAPKKNAFLYQMAPYVNTFRMNLYGGGFAGEVAGDSKGRIVNMGFKASEDFIAQTAGDFGLVWDGDSLDDCTGDFGVYLAWNAPHKISFYLRSHLPVLIWEGAAMAPFLVEKGAGMAVGSLRDLDGILSSLSRERYDEMKRNAIALSGQLSEGYYARAAVRGAEEFFASGALPKFNLSR